MRIVAHRGASAVARENSVAAVEAAIAAGADAIEMDARLSADGIPHVSHDPDLTRLAGVDLAIATASAAQLAALRAPDGPPWVLPLGALMESVAGRLPIVVDVKIVGAAMLHAIAAVAPRHGAMVIGVRDVSDTVAARQILPHADVLGLLADRDHAGPFADAGGRIFRLWEDDATQTRIAAARSAGLDVWVTAGVPRDAAARRPGEITASGLHRIAALGVDGILVNDPAAARAALGRGGA